MVNNNVLEEVLDDDNLELDGGTGVCIQLDDKYYFRSILYNYVISTKHKGVDKDGNEFERFNNLVYFPYPEQALNHYIFEYADKRKCLTSFESHAKMFKELRDTNKKILEPLKTFRRKLEQENYDLKLEISSLKGTIDSLNTKIERMKTK